MSAFELDDFCVNGNACAKNETAALEARRLREECIIAFKVYDSCRQQDCLTSDVLGPARALECTKINGRVIEEGAVIEPPENAATVSIDCLKVKKVIISDKEPNAFKNGFWDVTLKYVFVYKLIFREVDGSIIACIRATNIFTKKVTLFGSIENNIKLSTDLFDNHDDNWHNERELSGGPFILVESKAVALSAELRFRPIHRHVAECPLPEPCEVLVTIGLFTIIKLFRIANLTVESSGFCIPDECEEVSSAINPCEFFDSLDFPMDIFAPPQRPEFVAGISNNIPRRRSEKKCNCKCKCTCKCNEEEENEVSNRTSCGCKNNHICEM